jgi:hypothetical protein
LWEVDGWACSEERKLFLVTFCWWAVGGNEEKTDTRRKLVWAVDDNEWIVTTTGRLVWVVDGNEQENFFWWTVGNGGG